jgi:choline-glycine betaine transporter
LLGGGLRSLQSGSVVTGLPFMVVIALICVGTMLGLVKARKVAQSQSPPKSQIRPEP